MKILLTCFDPFGNMPINASREVVNALNVEDLNAEIKKIEIPTIRLKALETIETEIQSFQPDAIISIGQAVGRKDITFERVGINVDDFRIKDNGGNMPVDEPIFEDGPVAYFSTLPIRAMVNALNDQNIGASISNTAGTFVCNHVLYGTRYLVEHKYPNIKSGFIHVPYLTEQGQPLGQPSMDLNTIVKGIHIALETLIKAK